MTVDWRQAGIAGCACLACVAAGVGIGHYAWPRVRVEEKTVEKVVTKVETQTQVQYVDRIVYRASKDVQRHKVVSEVTRPDGTKEKTTTEDVASQGRTGVAEGTQINAATESKAETRTLRVVEHVEVPVSASWRLSGGAGYRLLDLHPLPDLEGEGAIRLVGPLWLNARVSAHEASFTSTPEFFLGARLELSR